MEELFKSVPRDLPGLMSLPREKRVELYSKVVEEMDEISPTLEEFERLGDSSQCNVLLGCIDQFGEAESGYFVIPIALPCRSATNNPRNEKGWGAFGQLVEDALNDMRDQGMEIQPIAAFQDHGVLIIGFKAPPQKSAPPQLFGIPLNELLARVVGSSPNRKPEYLMMSKISDAVRRNVTELGVITDARMKAVVEEASSDIIDVKGFIAFIEEQQELHAADCTDQSCIVDRLLRTVKEVLTDRLKNLS